jgi:DNA-binding MarR family transcriptional regulator
MTKLSDTQLVILSAASQRDNRFVLPLPKSLKGGAATKVIQSLITKGLVEEADAKLDDPRWREADGRGVTLVITDAGLAALDGDTAATAAVSKEKAPKPAKPKKPARAPRQARKAAPRTRADSKQAKLIEMLKRAKGATIEEIAKAFDWQAHTVRGAIAGALKKKLGLRVTSEKTETRGRVYRIES